MKKILCPTDFSKTAGRAADYAAMLAQKAHAHLTLLHVVHLPIVDTSETAMAASELLGEQKRDALENLQGLAKHLEGKYGSQYATGWSCDFIVKEALLTDAIKDMVAHEGYDFVVMGTTGGGNTLEEILIGSNTEAVMEEVSCPVLAIPMNAPLQPFRKIVYASDYHEYDGAAIREVMELAKIFNSRIEVVHVNTEDNDRNHDRAEAFRQQLAAQLPGAPIDFYQVVNPKEDAGLKEYLNKTNSDMLAVLRKPKNFFRDLFRQSLAEKMTYQSKMPLLVLHARKH